MREFDFIEFEKNLQEDLDKATSLVGDIEKVELYEFLNYDSEVDQDTYEENKFNEDRLAEILELVRLKIEFVYSYLGLDKMSILLKDELEKYQGKFGHLELVPFMDIFFSPVQWIFQKHLLAITCHIKTGTKRDYYTSDIELLERILRGTAKILTDSNIEPVNEAEVKNEVYKTLIHVFPDTVKEIPIAKVSKTYKPDIGVKRIKSAIEYKFADTQEEAKTVIGGIFEDIQGYEGSNDWTLFYAVIYMTDNFLTQDQVEAEFKLSKVPHKWKPIVVYGKGKRKKKR